MISQIEDRGATVAWSPLPDHADIIALGIKDSGNIGFDDHGGELELYNLNITSGSKEDDKPSVVGSIKTTARFGSIGWSKPSSEFDMGLIAGGMTDGEVNIWNPSFLMKREEDKSLVSNIQKHVGGGTVSALQFNPHPTSLTELATGGSNGTVHVHDLSQSTPSVTFSNENNAQPPGEITKIAFNTQVSHILASSGGNGIVNIFDLRSAKKWCEIRESSLMPVSDLEWNPVEGLHLLTSSSDDRNPVLKLWDLRASTTVPLATLKGHEQGVLSVAWCPHDESLLLSCGRDNKTLLWDLYTLEPIYELPNTPTPTPATTATTTTDSFFGVGGSVVAASQQKRYNVQWSPVLRGILSTCSFDRKVQAHSVIGAATKTGRTPKWLKRPSGVSSGFGGSMVSFGSTHKYVTLQTVKERTNLVETSVQFEESIKSQDYVGFCNKKATEEAGLGNAQEAKIWGFMQIIFEANAREQLLQYLGFDPQQIQEMVDEYSKDNDETKTAEDAMNSLSIQDSTKKPSKQAEELIKQALIVGNFESAVECCFQSGLYADALILSSCGGAELWAKTQARYFELEVKKRPFLSIVSAVIHNQLEDLVNASDALKWRETLAILSTYGKSDEFPFLCQTLGSRLDEAGDTANASLCYMCSLNLERAVPFWKEQLDDANQKLGSMDVLALHTFVEKVTVFLNSLEPNAALDEDVASIFTEYAKILAEQGLLETAAKYCKGNTQECYELSDRLYNGRASSACRAIMAPPPFPFTRVDVGVAANKPRTAARGATAQRQTHQQQTQQGQQQQYQNADQLPEGWLALQDPSSGMTYYANQLTGQTQWEKPSPPVPSKPTYGQQTQQQQQSGYAQAQPQQQSGYSQAQPQQQSGYGQAQQQQQQGSYAQAQPQQQSSYAQAQPQQQGGYAQAQQQQYPSAQSQQQPYFQGQQQQQQQPQSVPQRQSKASNGTKPGKLAAKYGDGFVTSSSHPELAQQYGNYGTSNPYTTTARPGTAKLTDIPEKPPLSGNFDPSSPPEIQAEQKHISDIMLYLLDALSSIPNLNTSEQKQLAEITKGIGFLLKKLSRGEVEKSVLDKVDNMAVAMQNKDYNTASGIHTQLVHTDWKEHKDWLKGMKFLIQLSHRRI